MEEGTDVNFESPPPSPAKHLASIYSIFATLPHWLKYDCCGRRFFKTNKYPCGFAKVGEGEISASLPRTSTVYYRQCFDARGTFWRQFGRDRINGRASLCI